MSEHSFVTHLVRMSTYKVQSTTLHNMYTIISLWTFFSNRIFLIQMSNSDTNEQQSASKCEFRANRYDN
jgi:hypothetical protein